MGRSDQGASNDRYTIIPRSLCFIFRDQKVLLIKGAPTKRLWAGKYNGVGGHIERGEDILTATRREVFEETGLEPDTLRLCGIIFVDTGQNPGIGIFVFKGDSKHGDVVTSHEGELEWVDLNDLGNYGLVEDLYRIMPLVTEKPENSSPFLAQYTYDQQDRLIIKILAE